MDRIMHRCAKCKAREEYYPFGFFAVVELTDTLCSDCLDKWHLWCDTHRGEPFDNFLKPKPWLPRNPGLIVLDGVAILTPTEREMEDYRFSFPEWLDFDVTDETAWEATNNG